MERASDSAAETHEYAPEADFGDIVAPADPGGGEDEAFLDLVGEEGEPEEGGDVEGVGEENGEAENALSGDSAGEESEEDEKGREDDGWSYMKEKDYAKVSLGANDVDSNLLNMLKKVVRVVLGRIKDAVAVGAVGEQNP